MATDTATPRSRRALLAGAIGATVASVASALGRPGAALGADGGSVILGQTNDATNATRIQNNTDGDVVLWVESGTAGTAVVASSSMGVGVYSVTGANASYGVWGETVSAYAGVYGHGIAPTGSSLGVLGESTSPGGYGVYGNASDASGATCGVFGWVKSPAGTAVQGYSGTGAIPARSPKTGIFGYAAQDAAARGVRGQTLSGHGTEGVATTGVGLYGTATTGYALRTSGRIRLDKVSGVANILAGNIAVEVTPGTDITSSAFVLLTPQGNPGSRRFWATLDTVANTLTISTNATSAAAFKVAWLLMG